MKFAISNIAWPNEKTEQMLPLLKQAGISGLEVAPTKIWPDIFKTTAEEAKAFVSSINRYGLQFVGFHALLYGQKDLSIFGTPEVKEKTLAYLRQLAKICFWCGGGVLVFGSPQGRRKGTLSNEEAEEQAIDFFRKLLLPCDDWDAVFVIEPLGKSEADFVTSAEEALSLIQKINHHKFQGHLDAKALAEAEEINEEIFKEYSPVLRHFHVNDPGLRALDKEDKIGHRQIGRMLKSIGYQGYISLEQRTTVENPINRCLESINIMRSYYE